MLEQRAGALEQQLEPWSSSWSRVMQVWLDAGWPVACNIPGHSLSNGIGMTAGSDSKQQQQCHMLRPGAFHVVQGLHAVVVQM